MADAIIRIIECVTELIEGVCLKCEHNLKPGHRSIAMDESIC